MSDQELKEQYFIAETPEEARELAVQNSSIEGQAPWRGLGAEVYLVDIPS